MAISKVIYGSETLIDLTNDTVAADKLLSGYTAHGKDGEKITGTCDYDANTQSATASADEILSEKTAFVRGSKVTGTMPNKGSVSLTIIDKNDSVTIAKGYHDGTGTAAISSTEKAKIIPDNIREGVTLLGVAGTMSGSEDVKAQNKTVTPTTASQTVLPDADDGYTHLAQVTVAAIPYAEAENSAGGKTVTIG